jgi:hypothetical protein
VHRSRPHPGDCPLVGLHASGSGQLLDDGAAGAEGTLSPHAFSAACTVVSENMFAPPPGPPGPPDGAPEGAAPDGLAPVRAPDEVGIAIPAALKHSWIFVFSAEPPCPPAPAAPAAGLLAAAVASLVATAAEDDAVVPPLDPPHAPSSNVPVARATTNAGTEVLLT